MNTLLQVQSSISIDYTIEPNTTAIITNSEIIAQHDKLALVSLNCDHLIIPPYDALATSLPKHPNITGVLHRKPNGTRSR